jgi:hypothetical protein
MSPIVDSHFDLDTAEGFEDVIGNGTPEFVLRRGTMGTFNITLTSNENETVVSTYRLIGRAPDFNVWSPHPQEDFPDGAIYTIEPSRLVIPPNSSATATVSIAATIDTKMKSYRLLLDIHSESGTRSEGGGPNIVLTVTEGISISTSISNGTAHVTHTVTTSVTETKTAVFTTYKDTSVIPQNGPDSIQSTSIGIGIAVAGIAIALAISRRGRRVVNAAE